MRLVNSSFSACWQLNRGNEHLTFDPEGPPIGNTAEVLLDGVLHGLGIALLPAYSVVDGLRSGRLVQVLPGWRSPEIGIFALLSSGRFVDAKTRAWIDLLKQELPPAIERDMAYFTDQAGDL